MGKAFILWLLGVPFTSLVVSSGPSGSFDKTARGGPVGLARV